MREATQSSEEVFDAMEAFWESIGYVLPNEHFASLVLAGDLKAVKEFISNEASLFENCLNTDDDAQITAYASAFLDVAKGVEKAGEPRSYMEMHSSVSCGMGGNTVMNWLREDFDKSALLYLMYAEPNEFSRAEAEVFIEGLKTLVRDQMADVTEIAKTDIQKADVGEVFLVRVRDQFFIVSIYSRQGDEPVLFHGQGYVQLDKISQAWRISDRAG